MKNDGCILEKKAATRDMLSMCGLWLNVCSQARLHCWSTRAPGTATAELTFGSGGSGRPVLLPSSASLSLWNRSGAVHRAGDGQARRPVPPTLQLYAEL